MKKAVYLTGVIVVGLLFLTLYQTYAMFTSSVSSDTVINLDTTLNYKFKINTTQTFKVDANTVLHFNAIIENEMEGSIKYGIYHNYNLSSNTNVQIGEIVLDASTVTTSPNGTGVINASESKTVPIAIINNSNATIEVSFCITTGYTSNTLTYPANTYALVKTIDDDAIGSASCESNLTYNEEDCYEEIISGVKYTRCIITTGEETVPNLDTSGANAPVLADGMIPVYWNGTGWAKADKDNVDPTYQWYDYNAKKWANAVMVTSGTRTAYMSNETKPLGTVIPESDILAYYVWIPRYKYQLFNVGATKMSPIQIQVQFEYGTPTKSNGTANGQWLTHPAFTFGTDELKGIWVGKFSTTGDATTPTIKPNRGMLTNQKVSTQFTTSQKFGTTTYLTSNGVSEVDAHMMKNTEWGAVAYLKQSKYGLGTTDIGLNNYNSSPYLTGCGAASGSEYSTTCNAYNTTDGMSASTTGNVYGIYDMSTYTGTYVMGVMQDNTGTNTPMSGYDSSSNSGFTGKIYASGNFTQYSGVSFPNSKYYDLYAYGTSYTDYTRRILGDATGEVAFWYDDISAFVDSDPWFVRGRTNTFGPTSAGVFTFVGYDGGPGPDLAFRSVLTPNS